MLQTDATYKLTWQGYPVLLVGTSDADKVFHPFALAVTKGETTTDFTFLFQALHNAYLEWSPTILMADGSDAISNGFTAVFGPPITRLMCFFHVIKNLETYFKPLTKKGVRLHLKEDIYALQSCSDKNKFSKAAALFMVKWRKKDDSRINDFLDYFEREWLIKYPNWFEGAAVEQPSTNNGIESTNAIIKKEHTMRERLPVGQFLNCMADMVEKWSRRRNPSSTNCLPVAENPSTSLKAWTDAYQWAARNVPVLQRDEGTITWYYVTSSRMGEPITARLLKKFQRREDRWANFDDFKSWRTEVWTIVVSSASVTCTCPFFIKKRQCKHALGIKIRRKEVAVPPEAKSVPLGQRRKRGRPSKAKQALLV